jgi:hypothetical protein
MVDSQFRTIIVFFDKLGVYDVILPFLLVFTVVFAILEKSKILGTEKIGGETYTKKNLNAMFAFVVAFLVVASTQLVSIINEALARVVLLLMISICFLLLIGSFFKNDEDVFLEKGMWRTSFMLAMLVGTLLIFLWAIKTSDGTSWLEYFWTWVSANWDSTAVGSVILMLVIILFMWFIVKEPSGGGDSKKEKKSSS